MSNIEVTDLEPTETRLDVLNTDNVTTPNKRGHSAPLDHVIDLDSSQYHPFSIEKNRLSELVRNKDIGTLRNLGGVGGVASALQSDIHEGILGDADDFVRRREIFGSYTYRKPPSKSFFHFLPEEIKNVTTPLLLACGCLLAIDIKVYGLEQNWYHSRMVLIAILSSALVPSAARQSRKIHELCQPMNEIHVDVTRNGRHQPTSISEIVVGDVIFLNNGDQVPADGLFIEGHSLKVDESSITEETQCDQVNVNSNHNPFLLSGSKVVDGYGKMLVTSVGMNTTWGHSQVKKWSFIEQRLLLECLKKFCSVEERVAFARALLPSVITIIMYLTTGRFLATALSALFLGFNPIIKFYPIAVSLTLSYSTKKMTACKAMVRELSACKRMGNATTICTNKTGTLTLGQMKVTKFWFGLQPTTDFSSSAVTTCVLGLVQEGIALNTSGSVSKSSMDSKFEFSGSPTEKALLSWVVGELETDTEELTRNCTILHVMAFDSTKKQSGVLLRRREDNSVHVHWKGAAEIILNMCSKYFDSFGILKDLNDGIKLQFEEIVQGMATGGLRCIAFAHAEVAEDNQENKQIKEDGLTLLGLVGIKDPCRLGVKDAVKECQLAGVKVKMITGDNVFTSKAVAIECGIIEPNQDGAVIEGKEFRSYKPEERLEKVDKICVMAGSTPHDKVLMLQYLKKKGHKVAVTGHTENDVSALIEADIGLSMGVRATKMAKEHSDIVISDDKFETITTVLRWGRYVNNSINKCAQFQVTAYFVALLIDFVPGISVRRSPLTALKLVGVNLVMETLSVLAYATETPPVDRTEPLITDVPWLDIFIYGFYQIEILLVLLFKGESLFGVTSKVNDTLIFSVFVLCQPIHGSDAVHPDWNFFKNPSKKKMFWGMAAMTLVLQVVIVEILKMISEAERLDWGQWMACIGIAYLGWPIGYAVNLLGLVVLRRSFLYIATFAKKNTMVMDDKPKLQLSNLIRNKDKEALLQFEGVNGVVKFLETDERKGIEGNHQDITRRQKEFGHSKYHNLSTKRFYQFVIVAIKDPVVLVLTTFALFSVGLNIRENGLKDGCYNGGSILIVLVVVVITCSVIQIWPQRQINKLSKMVKEIEVELIRNGETQHVSISQVVVGDIVCLKEGNRIPADGLFLGGNELKLDGWSLAEDSSSMQVNRDRNPFLFYGSKVQSGFGNMLVTSVGENTKWAETAGLLGIESHEWISLKRRFKRLSGVMGSVGSALAISLSADLMIRYFTKHPEVMNGSIEKTIMNDKTEGDLIYKCMFVIHIYALLVYGRMGKSGSGKMLVTSVGDNRKWAMTTRLLGKRICKVMGSVGSLIAVLLSAVLWIFCFPILLPMWKWVVGIQVSTMATASSAIPEGLPLIYALTVAYTLKRMMNIGVLPRSFSACETLASATTICLSIEGTELQTDGVRKAVQDCKKAEVNIKLITGDIVSTAKAIASQSGILESEEELDNEQVMQAFDFRNYTEAERREKIEKVRVLVEATSFDKLLFVKCLKDKGHRVAVTGHGEGDALALKGADVGIHIGNQSTDLALENSDIIVLHGGLVSAVAALHMGRGIYDDIKLFIQFMFTANIVSLVSDIVSMVLTGNSPKINILTTISVSEVPYAVLQMMWVKIIVGTLSALVAVVETKNNDVMHRPLTKPDQPLISKEMCRNILIHASFEIAVLLTLQFKGEAIFHLHNNVKDTLIFNLFVLFRVFAVFTPWKSGGNFFSGVQRRKLYWGIVSAIVIIQIVIVETLPRKTATKTLNVWQWGACFGIAFTSWPVGYLGSKCITVPEKSFLSYVSELKCEWFAWFSKHLELFAWFGKQLEWFACFIVLIFGYLSVK